TKIKFFDICGFDNQNIYLVFDLIRISQNLNYLTINIGGVNHTLSSSLSSIVLQNLGQVLPIKLEYLKLNLLFNANEFEVFLKKSSNTFIKTLIIIRYEGSEGSKDILPYIEEYITKKNRVKYLCITDDNTKYYEVDVKEFESYSF